MGQQGHAVASQLLIPLMQVQQASRVVVMAVRNDDAVEGMHRQGHGKGIFQEYIRIAGVKQPSLAVFFQIVGKAGLTDVVLVDKGIIVY